MTEKEHKEHHKEKEKEEEHKKEEEKEEEKKDKRGFWNFLKNWQEIIALGIGSVAGVEFIEKGLPVLSSHTSTSGEINGAIVTALLAGAGLVWGIAVDASRRKKLAEFEEKEEKEEEEEEKEKEKKGKDIVISIENKNDNSSLRTIVVNGDYKKELDKAA